MQFREKSQTYRINGKKSGGCHTSPNTSQKIDIQMLRTFIGQERYRKWQKLDI
jgi:hypothetical protein